MRYGVFGGSLLFVFLFISFGYLLSCPASRPYNISAFCLYILGLYLHGLFIRRFGLRRYASPFGIYFVSFSLLFISFGLGWSIGFVAFVIFDVCNMLIFHYPGIYFRLDTLQSTLDIKKCPLQACLLQKLQLVPA